VRHGSEAPALGALLRLLQFMVPEQLRSTIVQQHVQGHVSRGSPPPRDRALLAPQFGNQERIPHPHPPADSRIFGLQCFSLLLARHPWSNNREQGSEPSLPSSNAIANTRGYTDVMPQYPAKNTSARFFSSEHAGRPGPSAGSHCVSRLRFPLLTRTTRNCSGQLTTPLAARNSLPQEYAYCENDR